jgi:ribosomal protein L29
MAADKTSIEALRAFTDAELEDELREAKQDLWSARFKLSTRQLADYSSIPHTRRRIARILTVKRERASADARTA